MMMSADGEAQHVLHHGCIRPSTGQHRPFCKSFRFTEYKEHLPTLSPHTVKFGNIVFLSIASLYVQDTFSDGLFPSTAR